MVNLQRYFGTRRNVVRTALFTSAAEQAIGMPSPFCHSGNWSA